jgi:hypothetical protein
MPCRGPNKISYCKQHYTTLNEPNIVLLNLSNPRLQFIFNLEIDDMIKSFEDLKQTVDEREYRYEIILAFWLSIHLQLKSAAVELLQLDTLI